MQHFRDVKSALAYIGGMSKPSKMPCRSYSIPASKCKIGQIMRKTPGSVCSKCYALKGRYGFARVQKALMRRFRTLSKPLWVEAFSFIINTLRWPYFRFHDSGDLQGVWHLDNIVKIAQNCPACRFWLPTREARIVTEYMDTIGVIPNNLTIRMSGTMLEGPPPVGLANKYGLCVSSVSSDANLVNCHSFKNEGKCGNCRACWSRETFEIVYRTH